MPANSRKASATVMRSGAAKGSAVLAAKSEGRAAGGLGGGLHDAQRVLDDRVVTFLCPVPFEHGEFRGIQIAVLAVAIDGREREDLPFARRQQFLAGEFRRGVEITALAFAAGRDLLGREGMEMGFVSRRDLKRAAFDLDEALVPEIGPCRVADAAACHEKRTAIAMDSFVPPRRAPNHGHDGAPVQAPWPP